MTVKQFMQRILFFCLVFAQLWAKNSDSSNVVLFFGGDVTLADHFENHVGDNLDYAFSKMKWFADADISMINLENPLTERGEPIDKKFTFRARPAYAKMLKNAGIDIVTLANNHMYDFGSVGLDDTVDRLMQENIYFVGAGRNIYEARHPVIFYIKGLRIAYFGYYGTHKHSESFPAREDSSGTALRQLPFIKEDIEKYRDAVDFIVINFHWGTEKAEYPAADQIEFAHQVIEYGADLIVGHHPHVLQGIEKYKSKVIAYSLGNFIFGGNSRKTYDTAVLKIELEKGKDIKASVIPIEVNYWQPHMLQGEKGLSIITYVMKISDTFEKSVF
jgi:poly-gamma-glutamate synthesis protein (capsule biosynthesis protein)